MSNHDDEDSEERVRLGREARLERQARLAELNVPIKERLPQLEEQEPVADIGVNPFREGQDVQFELPEDHPLRAAAAARNRVPSAAVGSCCWVGCLTSYCGSIRTSKSSYSRRPRTRRGDCSKGRPRSFWFEDLRG